jgi:small subunit ribosomal protein S9
MSQEFISTGRRKTAVARIRMSPGSGRIEVNGKPFEEYFKTPALQNTVLQPLEVAKSVNVYDLSVNARGGGATGQAGAIRLAIARAWTETNTELRAAL